MSVTTAGSAKRLDIGKVLGDGLGVLARNFVTFFILALLLVGLPFGLVTYGQVAERGHPGFAILSVVGGIALLVTSPMAWSALIYGSMRDLEGQPASLSECLTVGRKRWLPCLGLGILTALGVVFGFVFLIVPGVLLALRWSVAMPVMVFEGRGVTESMGRSAVLTRDRRWSIFLLGLIFFAVTLVIEIVLAILGVAISGAANVALFSTYLSPVINTFTVIITYPVLTALFRQLRGDKEGIAPDALAEVFA